MPGVVAVGFPGDAQAAFQKHPHRHHKPLSIHQPYLLAVRTVCATKETGRGEDVRGQTGRLEWEEVGQWLGHDPQRTVKQRWLFWKETDKESRTEDSHPLLPLPSASRDQGIVTLSTVLRVLADLEGLRLVRAGKQRV